MKPQSESGLGSLPVYVQISELISRRIAAGQYLDGERLPPERHMSVQLNVAVGTLRKSLRLLEDQGLLRRVQGSGNYIQTNDKNKSIYAFFRLETLSGGGLPTARLLNLKRLTKPADAPNFGNHKEAYRFRRLRFLDDLPIALEEIWLDASLASKVVAADVSESLYHFYAERLKMWIGRAEDRVSIAPAPDWKVDAFAPAAGQTVGYIERIAWSQNGDPVEYSRTWFDPNLARYISRLK